MDDADFDTYAMAEMDDADIDLDGLTDVGTDIETTDGARAEVTR